MMGGLLTQGIDTACITSLQPGRLVTGIDLLAQRCFHRLITPTGSLRGGEEEADFGRDLAAFVGSVDERAAVALLPAIVRNEFMKDPEISAVTVDIVANENAGAASWRLTIGVQSARGPFDLIVDVSALTVDLIGVT